MTTTTIEAQFLYVFRGGLTNATPAEMQKHMEKWLAWSKDLGDKGRFVSGEPLEAAGKTVRGKEKTVTDGPFAEAKDLVGGFMLVKAKDLADATDLARGCPILDVGGSVEVRRVLSRM